MELHRNKLERKSVTLYIDEDAVIDPSVWDIGSVIKTNINGVYANELGIYAPNGEWSIDNPTDFPADELISEDKTRMIIRRGGDVLGSDVTSHIRFTGSQRNIEIYAASYLPVPTGVNYYDILIGPEGLYPGKNVVEANLNSHTHAWFVGENIMVSRSVFRVEVEPNTAFPWMSGVVQSISLIVGFNIGTGAVEFVHNLTDMLMSHLSIPYHYDTNVIHRFAFKRNNSAMLGSNVLAFVLNTTGGSYLVRLDCMTGVMSSTMIVTGVEESEVFMVSDSTTLPANTVLLVVSQVRILDRTTMLWGMAATLSDSDSTADPVFSEVVQLIDEAGAAPLGEPSIHEQSSSFSISTYVRQNENVFDVFLLLSNVMVIWPFESVEHPIVGSPRYRGLDRTVYPVMRGSAHVVGDHIFFTQAVTNFSVFLCLGTDYLPIADIQTGTEPYIPSFGPIGIGNQSIYDILNSFKPPESFDVHANVLSHRFLNGDLYIQFSISGGANGRLVFVRLTRRTSTVWDLAQVYSDVQRNIGSSGFPEGFQSDVLALSSVDNTANEVLISDGAGDASVISTSRVGMVLFESLQDDEEEEDSDNAHLPLTSPSSSTPSSSIHTSTPSTVGNDTQPYYDASTSVGAIIGYVVAATFMVTLIAIVLMRMRTFYVASAITQQAKSTSRIRGGSA